MLTMSHARTVCVMHAWGKAHVLRRWGVPSIFSEARISCVKHMFTDHSLVIVPHCPLFQIVGMHSHGRRRERKFLRNGF